MFANFPNISLIALGSSILDVVDYQGSVKNQPGGIYYSLIGLQSIKDENDLIDVISNYDSGTYPHFEELYKNFGTQFLVKQDQIAKVYLKVFADKERYETYCNVSQKIILPKINYSEYDGILVNMTSGFDISLIDLQKIRSGFNGLIYIDIHTLARGFNDKNERIFRYIPDAEEWVKNVDIIQVNENELRCMSEKSDDDKAVEYLMSLGLKALIVTKAEKGAVVYWKEMESIDMFELPGLKIKAENPVGCGDVFGAVFFYSYIKNKNFRNSLTAANKAAGVFAGIGDFNNLKNLKSLINEYN